MNLLRNPDFETEWSPDDEFAHRAFVLPVQEWREIGNIFTPPDWRFWFVHEPGIWDQPEARDARATDPDRMLEGEKGFCWFTFARKHDAGLFQQVQVEPGASVSFSIYAHAWSNHKDDARPGDFPHPDDPFWSEGAGFDSVAWPAGSQPQTGDPQQDAKSNFAFWVGIDPTGGIDALADTVAWGDGYHIYNGFDMLFIEAVAQAGTITVFVRSQTLWQFKHNDAYVDTALLLVDNAPDPPICRGLPRVDYPRIVNVIPGTATDEQAAAVFMEGWQRGRETVGASYDDAMIGDLSSRQANLYGIPPEQQADFIAFRDEYYPGAKIQFHYLPGDSPVPPPIFPSGTKTSLHLQAGVQGWLEYVRDVGDLTTVKGFSPQLLEECIPLSPDTMGIYRKHIYDYYPYIWDDDPPAAAKRFLDMSWDDVRIYDPYIRFIEGVNECCDSSSPEKIEAVCRFELALAKELVSRQSQLMTTVGLIAMNWPGGNGEANQVHYMHELAAYLIEHHGAIGYHSYPPCHPDPGVSERWLTSEAEWYHLRPALMWQPEFDKVGLQPDFVFTEAGPCGAFLRDDGGAGGYVHAGSGWRAPDCLNGDWPRTLALLAEYERMLQQFPQILSANLFTSGGSGWEHFEYGQAEFESLAGSL